MKTFAREDKDEYQKLWSEDNQSILQSWQWGEFKTTPRGIVRTKLDSHVMTIFIKEIPATGWKFGYVPHGGPKNLFTKANSEILREVMNEYELGHILIDPYVQQDKFSSPPKGFELSGEPTIQTRQTLITSLLEDDDEMMNRMRKKHRQYIRKSERLGLIFETDDSLNGAKRLAAVLQNQHTTKNYLAYPSEYYQKLWSTFEGTNIVHLHIVTDGNQDVGAYMVIDGSDRVFQFYGGTTARGRKMYGAYLLTWRSMLAARDRGFKLYDQWGISPYNKDEKLDSTDERYGISVFKEGFTGEKVTYGQQLSVVRNQSRYTIYKNLVKLHRSYIKLRKSF